MPLHLKRYQQEGHTHLLTFSCDQRRPYLADPQSRDLFEFTLEQTRKKYGLHIFAYVVMPEHVHLLVSEPTTKTLASAMQSLKLSVSKQSTLRPFWLPRYYDFSVTNEGKHWEKIKYIHRNPVTRGLVQRPEDWPHSSFLTYATRTQRAVEITFH